jgi:hypothetical protein
MSINGTTPTTVQSIVIKLALAEFRGPEHFDRLAVNRTLAEFAVSPAFSMTESDPQRQPNF